MRLVRSRMPIALAGLAACNSAVVPPPDPAELVVLKQVPAITTPGWLWSEGTLRTSDGAGPAI